MTLSDVRVTLLHFDVTVDVMGCTAAWDLCERTSILWEEMLTEESEAGSTPMCSTLAVGRILQQLGSILIQRRHVERRRTRLKEMISENGMQREGESLGPFPVYVPRSVDPLLEDVMPGSAIVGFPTEGDPRVIHIYYEGNRYGSPDLMRFADRAKHAAGRCRAYRFDLEDWRRQHGSMPPPVTDHGYIGYPTSAQRLVPSETLIQVATYDDVLGIVSPLGPTEASLLFEWIGTSQRLELMATGFVFESRRRTAGLEPGDDAAPSAH